ncbi:MAG: phosphatase PAP2 family protein [Hyphomicrobiaceae bacterium]|nr:phosphatase PAP2 family protein [Hyphomicrobiaceae bacterium]
MTLAATVLVMLWLLIGLLTPGGLAQIDYNLMAALHEPYDSYDPIGPIWLDSAMRDISALGSNIVLAGIVIIATILLTFVHRIGPAVMLVSATTAAFLLNNLLKLLFDRTRPDFLADSVVVSSSSFPSSHAMLSVVVYLLLAAIAAREMTAKSQVTTTLSIAVIVALTVGFSRIYLGAHWPSDVLAGWLLGAACALAAWQLSRAPTPPSADL